LVLQVLLVGAGRVVFLEKRRDLCLKLLEAMVENP
jgi:hypothetical protein